MDLEYASNLYKVLTTTGVKQVENGKIKGREGNKLLEPSLLEELSKSDVQYNPDHVIMIGKDSSNKLFWFEKGKDKAVLKHIVNGHIEDFNAKGVQDIPSFLHDTLKIKPIK